MNTHTINKQIIDLKVTSEESAFGIQQQVREAYMSSVLPLISDVLDELAGPDEVLRIDHLEIDFGVLQLAKMGEQMRERVREALLSQFPKLNRKTALQENKHFSIIETVNGGKKHKAQLMSESFSQRELLEIFFETGILPWWAPDELEAPDVDEILLDLLQKEPITTLHWLQQLAQKSPFAIERLVMQVNKKTRQQIIAAFPKKLIGILEKLSIQLEQVKGKAVHFPWQEKHGDNLLFSALILPKEFLQPQVNLSNHEILNALITQLASSYQTVPSGIEQQLYANALSEMVFSHGKANAAPDVVSYLIEWEKKHPEIAASVSGSNYPALEVFSENDHLSISKLADTIERSLKEFEERQMRYSAQAKKSLGKIKRQHQQKKKQTTSQPFEAENEQENRMEENLLEIPKSEITENVLPENETKSTSENSVSHSEKKENTVDDISADVDSKHKENEFVKINWYKTKEAEPAQETKSPAQEKSTDHISPIHKDIQVDNTTPIKSETKETATSSMKEENEMNVVEQTNIEEEERDEFDFILEDHPLLQKKPSAGMTRFGGLVLIAPFLPAFFNELKLTVDGVFPSEVEQHKALHLLNYLGSGKTSSPEYALMLHKLLCGIEITTPVPKSVKLSAAEKKEAMIFLDDIAGQWTTLRSTSGKALRDTFFQRNGILEKKDRSWLVRVERGPMDIMLDTLPWTISIIKAPWMQQLLQVEW